MTKLVLIFLFAMTPSFALPSEDSERFGRNCNHAVALLVSAGLRDSAATQLIHQMTAMAIEEEAKGHGFERNALALYLPYVFDRGLPVFEEHLNLRTEAIFLYLPLLRRNLSKENYTAFIERLINEGSLNFLALHLNDVLDECAEIGRNDLKTRLMQRFTEANNEGIYLRLLASGKSEEFPKRLQRQLEPWSSDDPAIQVGSIGMVRHTSVAKADNHTMAAEHKRTLFKEENNLAYGKQVFVYVDGQLVGSMKRTRNQVRSILALKNVTNRSGTRVMEIGGVYIPSQVSKNHALAAASGNKKFARAFFDEENPLEIMPAEFAMASYFDVLTHRTFVERLKEVRPPAVTNSGSQP